MKTKEEIELLMAITEQFQDDCHAFSNEIKEMNTKLKYPELTVVWMFKKFAEFEIRLQKLESLKTNS